MSWCMCCPCQQLPSPLYEEDDLELHAGHLHHTLTAVTTTATLRASPQIGVLQKSRGGDPLHTLSQLLHYIRARKGGHSFYTMAHLLRFVVDH